MGRLTVRLPNGLHHLLETLARSEGVSLNQYLLYALTRQATLDAYLKPELNNTPQLSKDKFQPDSLFNRSESGESEEASHLSAGGLPPPVGD